jgi:hypothetical protein
LIIAYRFIHDLAKAGIRYYDAALIYDSRMSIGHAENKARKNFSKVDNGGRLTERLKSSTADLPHGNVQPIQSWSNPDHQDQIERL